MASRYLNKNKPSSPKKLVNLKNNNKSYIYNV